MLFITSPLLHVDSEQVRHGAADKKHASTQAHYVRLPGANCVYRRNMMRSDIVIPSSKRPDSISHVSVEELLY